MSNIPQSERNDSQMDFIDTARKLEERTIQVCLKWPKRYNFLVTQRTANLASEVYEYVQKANAIIPQTEAERQKRIVFLQMALGALFAYSQKIELAFRLFPISGQKEDMTSSQIQDKSMAILEELMKMCRKEQDAITGNMTYIRNMKLGKDPPKKKQ